jgi:hypothetical protein
MKLRSRHSLAFVFVVGALALCGCRKPDTIIVVEVSAPPAKTMSKPANQLFVKVTTSSDGRFFFVPKEPKVGGITFPTSFSLSFDESQMAPITVAIDAYADLDNAQGFNGFTGVTTQDHVNVGGQTVVSVFLVENTAPATGGGDQDGGADSGGGGAGGSGGGSGATGSAGATGAAGAAGGSGGASGAAGQEAGAPDTGSDASGLDAAAD